MIPLPKTIVSQDGVFILLTTSFLLISILKASYWKHAKLLFAGVFAQRHANKFLREENAFTERVNIITFLLMIINFSIVLIKILSIQSFLGFGLIILSVISFYIFKIVCIKIVGNIFMLKELTKLGVFFSFLFDRAFAVFVFPLVVFLCFFSFDIMKEIELLICVLIIVFFSLKLFWLWKIGTKAFGLSSFYIFLYLCALEIFPVLLLAKTILW